jgi:hypothetical protein
LVRGALLVRRLGGGAVGHEPQPGRLLHARDALRHELLAVGRLSRRNGSAYQPGSRGVSGVVPFPAIGRESTETRRGASRR